MIPHNQDRNLLLGVLAVQMGFVARDELINAMAEWAVDRSRGLGEILAERKALAAKQYDLLVELVDARLAPSGIGPAATPPSTGEASEGDGSAPRTDTATFRRAETQPAVDADRTASWGVG